MTDRPNARIATRKQPQQARSTQLVEDVLQAAVQVLASEGAQRFTMARVAERAGVSVGSLYQYFPNKAAVLFRLQHDEWRQTAEMLRGMLEDVNRTPPERLDVRSTIVMDEVEEVGHRIVASELRVRARVRGSDDAALTDATRRADAGCAFSALIRASATVSIDATLEVS